MKQKRYMSHQLFRYFLLFFLYFYSQYYVLAIVHCTEQSFTNFFLQMVVTEEIKNLRRLEAQRNELNAKGWYTFVYSLCLKVPHLLGACGQCKLLPHFAHVFFSVFQMLNLFREFYLDHQMVTSLIIAIFSRSNAPLYTVADYMDRCTYM